MQKIMNSKIVGAVHTPYLYKINVQAKKSDELKDKKVIKMINIDKAITYEKKVGS